MMNSGLILWIHHWTDFADSMLYVARLYEGNYKRTGRSNGGGVITARRQEVE